MIARLPAKPLLSWFRRLFSWCLLLGFAALPIQDVPWHQRVSKQRHALMHAAPPPELRELDVIVRATDGLWSPLFAAVSRGNKRFSHVGLIVRDDQGQFFVLHADADDTSGVGQVTATPWGIFEHDALDWAIYRPVALNAQQTQRTRALAWQLIGTPFDIDFDLGSQDKLYCTEFIAHAFAAGAGLPWPEERTEWNGKSVLTVDDLTRSAWLERTPMEKAAH